MFKRIAALFLALMLLIPCFSAAEETGEMTEDEITALLWEMYQTENGDAEFMVLPDEYEEPAVGKTGIFNLLLIGVDTSDSSLKGRSDTMLVASLNARTGEMRLLSFMRDTYVKIPGRGHNKLNAAYSYGGAKLLIKTLENNFGIHIDGYLAVNYTLMVELVDAIGGIEITVSEDEVPKLNGILEYYNYQRGVKKETGKLKKAGTHNLTGLQAMSYARIRKLDSDFVRVERQQKVILAIYRKICQTDLAALTNIVLTYIGRVGTDITLAKATDLVLTLMSFEEIHTDSLRIPHNGAYSSKVINETYFIVPKLAKCKDKIHTFLYEYPDY
ncbi:MAG: LCP family protein [Clostridia bacterium]|nr:LCP family protein [Clostridia bacterium]